MRNLHAYNYLLLFITALYITVSGVILLVAAAFICRAADVTVPAPALLIVGWYVVCFTSVHWWPSVQLLFEQVRRPIREEEKIITSAKSELVMRSAQRKAFRVLITDNAAINAAAIGKKTWLISTGALRQLTVEELAAVLAHEMGHHRSLDTVCGSAISISIVMGQWIAHPIRLLFRVKMKWRTMIQLFAILVAIIFIVGIKLLIIMPAFILLAFGPGILIKILQPLYLLVSRHTEYRQDAYAEALGFGPALRSAFLKIIASREPPRVSRWHITFHSTHPVTHDRIRRLDALSDLSANFSER